VPEETDCPYEVQYIWSWFLELDKTRLNGGMGFNPITHVEITAWSDGMDIDILPFERRAIRAVDEAYMIHCNSKDKTERKND
jgi:hypothetical protein